EQVKAGGLDSYLFTPDAGHKVLYTYKTLAQVFQKAGFRVDLLEYFDEQGTFHFKEWHPGEGMIFRSSKFDRRNKGEKLNYTSIILDAWKEV
ncbi:MAG: hypothetical protein Q8P39_01390, partial [Candidatus Yanofskybacteria bacterium]|nr:hypothetical protein [Candidatus Yanofskybacteria bacterium]